jgi:hypothetical protein
VETIRLRPGEVLRLAPDRRFARVRSHGRRFYGANLRLASNRGARRVLLRLRASDWPDGFVQWIAPGQTLEFQHDLAEVGCP